MTSSNSLDWTITSVKCILIGKKDLGDDLTLFHRLTIDETNEVQRKLSYLGFTVNDKARTKFQLK